MLTEESRKNTIDEREVMTVAPVTSQMRETLQLPPVTLPVALPLRRSVVAPTVPMTAVMDARPAVPATESLSYQVYSVGHMPPLRPSPPRRAKQEERINLLLLGLAAAGIAAIVAAAAIAASS